MNRRLQLGLALFFVLVGFMIFDSYGFSYCSINLGGSAIDNVNVSTNASVSSDKCVYFGTSASGQIAVNQSEGSLTSGNISVVFNFPSGITVSSTSASISGTSLNISDGSFSWTNASSKTIDFSYSISGSASGKFNVTIYYNGTINGVNVSRSILLDPVFGLGSYQVYINLTNASDGRPVGGANVSLLYGGNGSNLANGTSNSSGAVLFTGIGAENYKVNASATNFIYNASSNFSVVENTVYNHTIAAEATKPTVTALYPPNNYFFNITNITFNWTATDNIDTNLTCNFSTNSTNGSSTIQTVYGNNTLTVFENLSAGAYKWNVTCFDDAPTPNNASSSNYTFYVDLTKPTISEVNVTQTAGSSQMKFEWNTSEITRWDISFGISNGTILSSEIFKFNTTNFSVTFVALSEWTSYNYSLIVIDRAGNWNITNGTFKTKGGKYTDAGSTEVETDAVTDPNENVSFIIRAFAGIKAGEEILVDLGTEGIVVSKVLITPNITSDRFRVEVRELLFAPLIETLYKRVYRYFQIRSVYLENLDIVKARVEAGVPREWMDNRGINKSDVAIFRYFNGSWEALNTIFFSEDVTKYYFTAFTPGFSYFAIGQASGNFSGEDILNLSSNQTEEEIVSEESGEEVAGGAVESAGGGQESGGELEGRRSRFNFVLILKVIGIVIVSAVGFIVFVLVLYIIIKAVIKKQKNKRPKDALYGY